MRALILAGGLGTRLRPLTYTRPKHLLPVANRAHIDHVLDLLQRHGVDEAVLLTSYLAEAFEPTVARAKERGFEMGVTHEQEPLGTAGAIKNAESFAGEGTLLVFNGDILTDVDLDELLAFHRDREAECTMLLTPVEDPSRFGVVPTDGDGRVEGFIEKPPREEAVTDLINAGVYVFEPSVLDRIPAGEVWSAERQLFPQLVDEEADFYAAPLGGYWLDIGTPASLLQANLDALEGAFTTDAVSEPGPRARVVAPGAVVAAEASVSSSCMGTRVSVSSGAQVVRSVLLDGVTVGEGARVEGSILGEGVRVAAGAKVDGQTIGDGEEIS